MVVFKAASCMHDLHQQVKWGPSKRF